MRTLLTFALCFCGVGARAEEANSTGKFHEPLIMMVFGKAKVTESSGKVVPAAKGLKLREKALIETEADGWVLVALTKAAKLVVAPSSRVSIPVISWDDGAIERIELQKGQMRLINLASAAQVVVTPLSRDPYSEADLVFDYDPAKPRLKLSVLEGKALFRGQENEEFLSVNAGEEATFQGVLENGELAYDVLLQGRRVVRGTMRPKSQMDPGLREHWSKAFDKLEKTRQRILREGVEKKRKGAICAKPQGKLNECAWICEGNPKKEKSKCRLEQPGVKCVRFRCDANGRWSDRTEIPAGKSPCGAQPLVQVCDY
jgi:hypothetical protein